MSSQEIPASSSMKRVKRKRIGKNNAELDQFDSLPWNSSLSLDDPFSLLVASNELEGGFLSLEEIDETQYGLEIPKPEREPRKEKPKAGKSLKKQNVGDEVLDKVEDEKLDSSEKLKDKKKKKRKKKKKKAKKVEKVDDIDDKDVGDVAEPMEEENDKSKDVMTEKKNKKIEKKKKNKKRKVEEIEEDKESLPVSHTEVDVEEEPVDESDFYAWNELRLHPVIMKSIYRLGFKEPTPIQKACIPAAAHQGKDVVGAAETGSGKTLAFGLPIFQRLLEEKEKASNMVGESSDDDDNDDKVAPRGVLRALIITPTRELALQVTDHLKAISKDTGFRVVPIVGGMSSEKQVRLLKQRPEIVVGTPGRLWELMSGGDKHLAELHSLSFFVLDEADRMIENGHFHELQSIIDMLPLPNSQTEENPQNSQSCVTVSSVQRKKRQTFVFSATIALSGDFRKKLKRTAMNPKKPMSDGLDSIEKLSQRAGMRDNVAIIDLTNVSIMANKLEESFIECREEDKDAYLYYILSVHGQGRTIVFCTSVAALRHLSSIMRTLGINVWTLHAQMQQRARLKAIDRFRGNEHSILLATDVAARGIDIPGVRTVVHYQLPHSAEVYVHRSGRTARASADGCSIALISPKETSKFVSLCKSFSKENFKRFPFDGSYMPEVMKRLSLARQIDNIIRKDSKAKANKSWLERNAESIDLDLENEESDDERANTFKQKKVTSTNVKKLQQELKGLLSRPLQPMSFSRRYLAGAGVTPLLHSQFQEMAKQKLDDSKPGANKRRLVVIGQDCVEPLQALRTAGQEVRMDVKAKAQKRENMENLKRKRKDEKKRLHDQKRKQKKKMKGLL